ncbi:DUF177 domain-containing protein [Saccharicrinis sp. FJH62]|uniref:YceD family protein n=1 Tax=Saccharicrinis sp. FJH62 TaxID=3344657 RepID=UPI0035D410BE
MKRLEEYIIPLKGLESGKQELMFHVEKTFIECFDDDEISDSDVDVILLITKTTRTFELHFKLKGTVHVPCDRCLDEMDLKIKGEFNLYLKYGEEFSEIDDEVIIIPREEGFFDLSSYVYEFVKLSIPISKFHKKGECNPEMLSRIIKTKKEKKQEIDPRWEALKKLGNNN